MLSQACFNQLPSQKSITKSCLFLVAIFVINGCATLNESDCRKGDWASIGYNDAAVGLRGNEELRKHNKACSRYQIGSDKKTYFSGYARGLQQFCTQEGGLRHGSSSSEYYGTCPKNLEHRFLVGYLPGLNLAMDNLDDDIEDLRHERRKKHRKLASLQQSNSNDKKHRKRMKKLRQSIESLKSDISSKRSEHNELRAWYSIWAR